MNQNPDKLLTFVFDAISRIASINDHDKLLFELSLLGRDIVRAERCTIWILDKRRKILWTKVAHGIEPMEIEAIGGIVGHAVTEKTDLIINDVQNNEYFHQSIDDMTGYTTKTMMIIPMINKEGDAIGAIQVMNKSEDDLFSELDLTHLKLASSYATESISATLLREEIDKSQKELINIVAMTGENRSKETGFHVKRVAEYSWLLATLYGLSERESDILRDVSPMHDIGKIGIPDAILNKSGRLDESEMHIMKTHAQLGYDILKYSDLHMIQAAAIVAHEHHEKYNGKGYPRQLKGEDIHIYGRITALADVFDALASERVYKKAWKDEDIFAFLQEEKGEHFDPRLIDLFLENKDKFLAIREEFVDVTA